MELDKAMSLVKAAVENLQQTIADVNAEGIVVCMNIVDSTGVLHEPRRGPWKIQVNQRLTDDVGGS